MSGARAWLNSGKPVKAVAVVHAETSTGVLQDLEPLAEACRSHGCLCRLPTLTAVRIPGSVDDGEIRSRLPTRYGIEIGGGLGPLKGRIWRIGLMGYGATRRNVMLVLTALGQELQAARWSCSPTGALAAAEGAYGQ